MIRPIVITGQTATGKTAYALSIAHKHNGELVNADSRQIYKHLNIITGKDLPNALNFTPHATYDQFDVGFYTINQIKVWLYDAVSPKKNFSSQGFVDLAHAAINEITSRGKVPIIVGGSYFYIRHLLYGFDVGQIPPDWHLRKEYNDHTVGELQQELEKLNKSVLQSMNQSDQNNPRRLIRRIEIEMYKKNNHNRINRFKNEEKNNLTLNQFIGLKCNDNETLEKRIKSRVEERIKMGAFEEVQSLLNRGYTKTDPGLQTIGYKQIIDCLEGSKTKQEAIDEWVLREVQYAKRQYTFMKKDPNITWINV